MQDETLKQSVRRRPERLFVSLNAREKATIEAAADGAQLNMTEWARTVLLEEARRVAKRVTRQQKDNGKCASTDTVSASSPFEQTVQVDDAFDRL
jgi:hypothetical protein